MSAKLPLLLLLFCAAITNAYPQSVHSFCGTTEADLRQIRRKLLENKTTPALQARSTVYVPVRFHMVAEDDGSGGVYYTRLLAQLCQLNEDFLSAGIQFYMVMDFNTINNSAIHHEHLQNADDMQVMRDFSAINVWIVDEVYSPNPNAVTSGAYQFSKDWLIIRSSEINGFSVTLTHEMGHFFKLLHTFNGWDFDPWTAQRHGNPAPAMSPRNIPTERQNGTNCDVAGDYICDTPPDYNFGFYANGCDYTADAQDPLGEAVMPDKYNFMTYFDRCDRASYHFSDQQRQLMRTDLASTSRDYIRTEEIPNFEPISGEVVLELPAWNDRVPVYNAVQLDWTDVTGATHYLVEIDRVPSFTLQPKAFVSDQSELQVTTLDANRTYYWRVRPFNTYHTCASFSDVRIFTTGDVATSASNIRQLSDWTIIPNPAKQNSGIEIAFDMLETLEAAILLCDLTGRRVREIYGQRFSVGKNSIFINTDNLNAGVYFLTLQTDKGRLTEKIVIH